MTRFEANDTLGNSYTIIVRNDGSVVACNQRRIRMALQNFYHELYPASRMAGNAEARKAIREAARKGAAALNKISAYRWTEVA